MNRLSITLLLLLLIWFILACRYIHRHKGGSCDSCSRQTGSCCTGCKLSPNPPASSCPCFGNCSPKDHGFRNECRECSNNSH